MEVIIGRHFEFEACHKLPDEDIYGICSKIHGHRYELDVEVKGNVKQEGWICDFKELKKIVYQNVIDTYDHSNLNDFFAIPTVENIGMYIFNKLNEAFKEKHYKLSKVKIHETSNSYVELVSE